MSFPPAGEQPAPLFIDTTRHPSGPCLRLSGELDVATAPQLLDAVAALAGWSPSGGGRLDLDLADLSFVDAAGLDALVGAQELALAGGRRLLITGAQPLALTLLEITGLLSVLEVDRPAPLRLIAQAARGEARDAGRPHRDLGIV